MQFIRKYRGQYKEQSERQYKNIMIKNIKKFRKNVRNEMKTMKTTNPKEYWNILNKGSKKKQPYISIEKLYDFFEDVNKGGKEEDKELNSEGMENNVQNNMF